MENPLMASKIQTTADIRCRANGTGHTRRGMLCSSSVAIVGLVAGSVLGQAGQRDSSSNGSADVKGRSRRGSGKSRDLIEKMRNGSREDIRQMMAQRSRQRQLDFIEGLKEELDISDQEWTLVRPRIEAVYMLQRPALSENGAGSEEQIAAKGAQSELRDCLRNEESSSDEIKTRLKAFRMAREKGRQKLIAAQGKLREIMTVRQEALLVLRGLLE